MIYILKIDERKKTAKELLRFLKSLDFIDIEKIENYHLQNIEKGLYEVKNAIKGRKKLTTLKEFLY